MKGAYWFSVNAVTIAGPAGLEINLFKNQERVFHLYEYPDDTQHEYVSNGVTLSLEVGDVVYIQLPAKYKLYDDDSNYTRFGGFLIFQM